MATSNFPNQIDIIKRLQDYPQSQAINIARYNELRQKSSLTSAEQIELASLRSTIGAYLLGAEDWNQVAETLESIQEFFRDNVDGYIEDKQEEMEFFVNEKKTEVNTYTDGKKAEMSTYVDDKKVEINTYVDGKQSAMNTYVDEKQGEINNEVALFEAELAQFTNKGLWSNLTTYSKWNTVLYNYETYMSLQNGNLNNAPVGDGTDVWWQKLSLRGAQGASGIGISFVGSYDNARTYYENEAVFYSNSIYVCNNISSLGNLPTDTNYWSLFLSNSGVVVSSTAPASVYLGLVWIDTSASPSLYKYWDGIAWQIVGSQASKVSISDSGSIISATNVETALQEIVKNPSNVQKVPTATGTGTAIILATDKSNFLLSDGYSVTFKASANNSGSATTINIDGKGAKSLYKPGTTTAPTLISDKYYTIVYSSTSDCFFIKASATGTATPAQVLAGVPFSNENDTDLVGTMTNWGAVSQSLPINGSYTIPEGYHNGSGKVTQSILTKAAQTYTPSQSTQIILAGQYLSGNQTIVGDADLVSANIKAGKNIFGVAGDSNVVDTSGDTVTSGSQMLSGYKAHSKGIQYTGTIPSKSAATYTPSQSTQTIAAGQYLSGAQTISAVSFDATKVLTGTTIAGKAGTMPNNGSQTSTLTITGSAKPTKNIPAGYTTGGTVTAQVDPSKANIIKLGETLGGVAGTYNSMTVSAGENLTYRMGSTQRMTQADWWTKMESVKVNLPGVYRIKFKLKTDDPSVSTHGRIYKNGTAVGTKRQTSSTEYVQYTQDLSAVAGDIFQIYIYTDGYEEQWAYLSDFSLYTAEKFAPEVVI